MPTHCPSLTKDILWEISQLLFNSQAKLSLLAFALCCQRHRDVCLDMLWSEMTELNPVFALADNMTVLDKYAQRIIRLTLNPAQDLPLLSASEFREIQEKKAGLLPNLRELRLTWSPVHTSGRRSWLLLPSILRGAEIVSIQESIPAEFPHWALDRTSVLCIGVGRSIRQLYLQGNLPRNVSSLQTLVQLKTFSLCNTKISLEQLFSLLTTLSTIQGLCSLSLFLGEGDSKDPEAIATPRLAFPALTTISLSANLLLVHRLLRVPDARSLNTISVTTIQGDYSGIALQKLFSALGDLETITCLSYSALPRARLPLAALPLSAMSASEIIQGIYKLKLRSLSLYTRFHFINTDIEVLASAFPTLSSLAILHPVHSTLSLIAPTFEALGCIADRCPELRDLAITLEIKPRTRPSVVRSHLLTSLKIDGEWRSHYSIISIARRVDQLFPNLERFEGWSDNSGDAKVIEEILLNVCQPVRKDEEIQRASKHR